jgi:hypothetical protein
LITKQSFFKQNPSVFSKSCSQSILGFCAACHVLLLLVFLSHTPAVAIIKAKELFQITSFQKQKGDHFFFDLVILKNQLVGDV